MTETQRKWLLKYMDKEWLHTDFTYAQDKQDLLEAIIRKNEWDDFYWYSRLGTYPKPSDTSKWLIQLSPEETAELICRWKGVE